MAPESVVVVEGRHLVEMDGVDGHHAAPAQTRERADDDFAAWREGDGAIELHGRLVIFRADPGSTHGRGRFSMGFTPGDDIDFAFPRLQNGQRQTCGAAETEEADAFALVHIGNAQASKSNNAGTQQRGDVDVIEAGRQGHGEVRAHRGVLSIAAVYGVAGEGRLVAQVFQAVAAIPATVVHPTHPGNSAAGFQGQFRGGAVNDFPNDLVAGDQVGLQRRKIAFYDVQVGATDAAGRYAEEHVAGGKRWTWNVLHFEESALSFMPRRENGSFHSVSRLDRKQRNPIRLGARQKSRFDLQVKSNALSGEWLPGRVGRPGLWENDKRPPANN